MTLEILAQEIKEIFFIFTLALPRIMACFVMLPILGKKMLGGTIIRNGVVFTLSIFMFPMVKATMADQDMSGITMIAFIIKESLIGLFIGFCASVPFWTIEAVGFFIDNQRGSTLASSFNPALEAETSTLGLFFSQVLTTIFFVSGAFLLFLGGIFESYQTWPLTTFFPKITMDGAYFFIDQFEMMLKLCVLYASPIIIGMFLAELGLGLISRFAQQLNVFSESLSLKSVSAFILLVLYINILIHLCTNDLFSISNFFDSLNLLLQP